MRAAAALIAVLCIVCSPASASAQTASITQLLFDDDGFPSLGANSVPDGSKGTVSWAICPPGGAACAPAGSGPTLDPGDVAAGTTFEASVTYQGNTTTDRSSPWQGRVTSTAPPALGGAPAVGAVVKPRAGAWAGGWGGELDLLRVQACRTASGGGGCETLSAPMFGFRRAVVGLRYVGWYVFAFEARYARQTAFPAIGYGSADAVPPLKPGQTVARSAALGPVENPDGVTVKILRRAQRIRGGVAVARVHCPERCRVVVGAPGDTRATTIEGTALVGPRQVEVKPGLHDVRVTIDGGLAAVGRSRLAR